LNVETRKKGRLKVGERRQLPPAALNVAEFKKP
jgi:hypothetical protein